MESVAKVFKEGGEKKEHLTALKKKKSPDGKRRKSDTESGGEIEEE